MRLAIHTPTSSRKLFALERHDDEDRYKDRVKKLVKHKSVEKSASMFRRINTVAVAVLFTLGLLILVAAAAYSGEIIPRAPTATHSFYDQSAYYAELGIWIVTAICGVLLMIKLRVKRTDKQNPLEKPE